MIDDCKCYLCGGNNIILKYKKLITWSDNKQQISYIPFYKCKDCVAESLNIDSFKIK